MNEIPNSFREMSGNLDLEKLSLSTIPSDFFSVAFDESLNPKGHGEWQSLDSNIKKFSEEQAYAFNLILTEILLCFIAADSHVPVT